jgi:serine/threonine-protein kinase
MIGRAAAAGAALAVAVAAAPIASADAPKVTSSSAPVAQPSRADALFTAAKQLRDAGQYEYACPKFAETEQLEPGVGVMLYLADCYQHTGHSANAWAEFRKAEKLARERNDKRADVAKARADALEVKVSHMTIAVTEPARHAGLEVSVDGTHIPQDHWNTALPTDPGEHAVAVNNPGQPPRTIHLTVNEGSALTVPVLEDSSAPASPAAPAASSTPTASNAPGASSTPTPSEAAPVEPATRSRDARTRTAVSVGLLSVGAVGLVVGAGFLNAKNEAISKNEKSDAGTISAVSFAVAGAALASVVVLYLVAPKDRSTGLAVSPAPIASGGGAILRGSF